MSIFKEYIQLLEELKELQKEIITISKNYNNELKLFQRENVIDSDNAEKVIEKYDALRKANEEIALKQQQIEKVEKRIEEYLIAVNGMSIRYAHQSKGINQPMIFELDTNSFGEQKIKMGLEN